LKKKAGELLGGDDDDDGKEKMSGSLEDIIVMGAPTPCHDVMPKPGQRRLRINPVFQLESQTKHEVPQYGPFDHDIIIPTISYGSVITTNDSEIAQVPSTDFGTTGSRIKFENMYYEIEHFTDYVTLSARLFQNISWAITDRPGREDVKADLASIDQGNWSKAADDLDPDKGKTSLGAPMRAKFWSSDITAEHEQFHAADKDKHMREVVLKHVITELKEREVDVDIWWNRYANLTHDLRALLNQVAGEAKDMQNAYMGVKGEQRAYAGDEPKYRARAAAIRKKAADNGWT